MGQTAVGGDGVGRREVARSVKPEWLSGNEHEFPEQSMAVLDDAQKQRSILQSLDDRRALFVPDRFIGGMKQVVEKHFALT